MYLFIVVLHVFLSLTLIGVILLQPGKGADPASAFGGGMSSAVFGPRGPANVLGQATEVVAVLFMVTTITLAFYSNRASMGGVDVEDELKRLQQEEQQKKAPLREDSPTGIQPGPVTPAPPLPAPIAPGAPPDEDAPTSPP